jgi:hypothetical protein
MQLACHGSEAYNFMLLIEEALKILFALGGFARARRWLNWLAGSDIPTRVLEGAVLCKMLQQFQDIAPKPSHLWIKPESTLMQIPSNLSLSHNITELKVS